MNPLTLIAPALLRTLGEPATYLSGGDALSASLSVIVNRHSQAQLPAFPGGRVLERRFMLQCRRSDLPTDLRPGDQFTLATAEVLVVKRLDADDGNTGLLTCSVQPVEA